MIWAQVWSPVGPPYVHTKGTNVFDLFLMSLHLNISHLQTTIGMGWKTGYLRHNFNVLSIVCGGHFEFNFEYICYEGLTIKQ